MTHKAELKVRIDREPYPSPNPTTGAALYALASIGPHRELFREIDGDKEDELVLNDDAKIDLKDNEHFYSAKEFTIFVNSRVKKIAGPMVSFDEIVKIAFQTPPTGENITFRVSYRNGPRANPDGTMLDGSKVKLKNGMVFNVTPTDKS